MAAGVAQAYVHASTRCWQAGETDLNARSLLLTISKGKQKLADTNGRTNVPDVLRELTSDCQSGWRIQEEALYHV